jgi:peptidoglycan/LPS O-acetylase OafA/YrhL
MDQGRPHLQPLTGLRIVLALWVVTFHHIAPDSFLGPYTGYLPRPIFSLIATGYAAVGAFFVLSGFILALNYPLAEEWSRSYKIRFGIARFARIYPIYLIGVLLAVPVTHLIQHPALEGVRGLLQISLLHSWWPPATGVWNSPSWSLSNEAFFYLTFPLLGGLLWRISRRSSLLITTALLWAAAMAVPIAAELAHIQPLCNSAIAANPHSFTLDLVRFNPLLRLPEFLMGVVSARLYLMSRDQMKGKGPLLYLPALAAMLIILTHGDSFTYPMMHNGLLAPLTCCLILGLAFGGGALCSLLSTRPMVFLGGASYAVYILQIPLGVWLEKLHLPWYRGITGMMLYLFVVLSLSSLAFKYFEEPASRWLKRRLVTASPLAGAGFTAMDALSKFPPVAIVKAGSGQSEILQANPSCTL